jgi:hypothetical protein
MRCSKATLIYWRTRNFRAVQLLLGHTKLESTVRIEVEDALEIAEQTAVQFCQAGCGRQTRRLLIGQDQSHATWTRHTPRIE